MKENDYQNSLPAQIPMQEFIALKNGIKPVLRGGLGQKCGESRNNLIDFCKKNQLNVLIKSFIDIYGGKYENIFYISESKELALRVCESEKKRDVEKLGELLGYPECCTDFYCNVISTKCEPQWIEKGIKFSYVLQSFLRTKNKPVFYTNNIFNVQSKMGVDSSVRELLKYSVNFFLISHIPCSYSCTQSVKLGRNILRSLKKETPKFAEKIVLALNKPFLFFDDYRWISFDGNVNGNTINYDRVAAYKSFYPQEKFNDGDKLISSDEWITILKMKKIIHEIEKKNKYDGFIIDFC